MSQLLLNVKNLSVTFTGGKKSVNAIENSSFSISHGTSLGVVGESGSGKSVTSLAIMRLLEKESTTINGTIELDGVNLLFLSEDEMRQIRGKDVAMIFQEPMTSLNPLHTCGKQIMESMFVHTPKITRQQAKTRAIELLKLVGISAPEQRFNEYPHQMSGGMRQRIMIAISLACKTKLLIADEPTTALDVTIQAQILALLNEIKEKTKMSIMLITHDLGVVKEMCDEVIVMYCGQIVEKSPTKKIFEDALHPYTQGLLRAVPKISSQVSRLETIEGNVPDLFHMPKGCRFAPRCPKVLKQCETKKPELYATSDGRCVRCFLYESK